MFKKLMYRNIIKGHGIDCDQESLEGRGVSLVRDRPRDGGGGGILDLIFLTIPMLEGNGEERDKD